jgi:lipopolysaccharide transport system ATP-binding protein
MSSPVTSYTPPVTSASDDEVLVRVEGVSKKFCRSLKKSLWYGVCDIAGELLPGRKRRETRDEGRELPDRSAQDISRSPLDAGLSIAAASALASGPSPLDSSSGLRAGEFFAVKDVSFELRRGELRTPGRSEKEISKKCLGATKVPDSGRRRHQCLGLIGHNRAGFNPILTGCSRLSALDARRLFPSMVLCLGSRKLIEFTFIKH